MLRLGSSMAWCAGGAACTLRTQLARGAHRFPVAPVWCALKRARRVQGHVDEERLCDLWEGLQRRLFVVPIQPRYCAALALAHGNLEAYQEFCQRSDGKFKPLGNAGDQEWVMSELEARLPQAVKNRRLHRANFWLEVTQSMLPALLSCRAGPRPTARIWSHCGPAAGELRTPINAY